MKRWVFVVNVAICTNKPVISLAWIPIELYGSSHVVYCILYVQWVCICSTLYACICYIYIYMLYSICMYMLYSICMHLRQFYRALLHNAVICLSRLAALKTGYHIMVTTCTVYSSSVWTQPNEQTKHIAYIQYRQNYVQNIKFPLFLKRYISRLRGLYYVS